MSNELNELIDCDITICVDMLKKWYKAKPGRIHDLCDELNITQPAIYRLGKIEKIKPKTWERIVKAVVAVTLKEIISDKSSNRKYWDTEPVAGQLRRMEFIDYFNKNPGKIAPFNRLIGQDKLVQKIRNQELKYSYFYHDAFLNYKKGKKETFYTRIDDYFSTNKKEKLKLCYQLYNKRVPDYKHNYGAHIFWRYCFQRDNIRNKRTMDIVNHVIEECKKIYK